VRRRFPYQAGHRRPGASRRNGLELRWVSDGVDHRSYGPLQGGVGRRPRHGLDHLLCAVRRTAQHDADILRSHTRGEAGGLQQAFSTHRHRQHPHAGAAAGRRARHQPQQRNLLVSYRSQDSGRVCGLPQGGTRHRRTGASAGPHGAQLALVLALAEMSMLPKAAAILEHIDVDAIARDTLAFLEVRSETCQEGPGSLFLADLLRREGFEATLDEAEPGRPNGYPRIRGQASGARSLLLNGHTDTIPIGASRPPALDGDWIVGRGAEDMKGGLVAMVHAASALRKAGIRLAGDLWLTGV